MQAVAMGPYKMISWEFTESRSLHQVQSVGRGAIIIIICLISYINVVEQKKLEKLFFKSCPILNWLEME